MCDFSIPENLWFVEHDEAQMTHVINNLITNAIESMPGGGTIKLTAENLIIGADDKKPALPLQDGTYVKISIRDQGIGIPEKDLPKVFDHYFSTKERGVQKGMGLGLAAVYSIIKRHDGHIAVESRVGVGTTFDIYLPAASAERKEFSAQRKPRSETAPVKGKILVMEDEEALRELSGKMLERLGYEAELAKDGAEAIELYKRAMDAGEPFDAVILDLSVQGGLGGKQAIQKLQEMDGEVKAIVSSGYTDDPVMCNFRQYGFSAALNKTYLKKDMSEALDKVLVEENIW
jgi:CheY-like chemotaxis protein